MRWLLVLHFDDYVVSQDLLQLFAIENSRMTSHFCTTPQAIRFPAFPVGSVL